MRGLRGQLVRQIIRHLIAPRFKRARSVDELRRQLDRLEKAQRVPSGTVIRPVSIGERTAEWVCAPAAREDVAVLFLHGGAFVMGSPASHRELAARLSAATGAALLVADYRLAPEHPFPAAVEDALAAYAWLLEEGFAPERLAIGGDSSGGGLALQTLIAARDRQLALPAAAFFLSPQADWVRFDGESYTTRADVDIWYGPEMFRFTASQYVGGSDPGSPLLSPLEVDLAGLPPMCIHVGDDEVLLSDSVRLAERARAAGVDVDLRIWPGMWHVFQASARLVPDARRSIAEIGRFVAEHAGSRRSMSNEAAPDL